MAVFDDHIEQLRRFMASLRARAVPEQRFDGHGAPGDPGDGLPIKIGKNANPGIIMRGDTFLELGNPAVGSCSHLLWTDDPSLVDAGLITLFGPDIPKSAGESLPFGQILVLAGEELQPVDHERLQQAPIIGDRIEGFMARSTEQNLWCRVSTGVAARGFDFEMLGRALQALIASTTPGITAMEVLFVTSGGDDVKDLSAVVSSAKEVGSEVLRQTWKDRGYDVDCDFDCNSCHDVDVCDDVRELIGVVKRDGRARRDDAPAPAERPEG